MTSLTNIFHDGLINDNIKFKLGNNSESAGIGSLRPDVEKATATTTQVGAATTNLNVEIIGPTQNFMPVSYISPGIDVRGITSMEFFGYSSTGIAINFTIDYSNDNETWFDFYAADVNHALQFELPVDEAFRYSFTGINANFIRVRTTTLLGGGTGSTLILSGKST